MTCLTRSDEEDCFSCYFEEVEFNQSLESQTVDMQWWSENVLPPHPLDDWTNNSTEKPCKIYCLFCFIIYRF